MLRRDFSFWTVPSGGTLNLSFDNRLLFISSYIKGKDSRGHEVPSATSATILANFGNDQWLDNIAPGESVGVSIIFDVADAYELKTITLRDSVFSGGEEVAL